jgi:hypothetical protein
MDGAGHRHPADLVCVLWATRPARWDRSTQTEHIFVCNPPWWSCAKCRSGRSATACLGHATIAPILKGKQAPPKQRLEDGISRNAPEDHPAMDVASEGKTADARTGSRLCEEGNRAERTSPKPTRPVRKRGGLAFATDRQVSYVCSTPGVITGSWEHPIAQWRRKPVHDGR